LGLLTWDLTSNFQRLPAGDGELYPYPDPRSENTDAILALWSITLAVGGVVVTVAIYIKQVRDSKLLALRIFGTLPNMKEVNERIVELLEFAENDPRSEVSAMVYWSWFGADLRFPQKIKISAIDEDASEVAKLLLHRFVEDYKTHLVIYEEDKDESVHTKNFVEALLKYRVHLTPGKDPAQEITPEGLTALLARYETDVKHLAGKEEQRRLAGKEPSAILKRTRDIPNLLFAMTSRQRSAGIIYLGETESLKGHTKTAGFYTEDLTMVKIIEEQIAQDKTNETPTVVTKPSKSDGGVVPSIQRYSGTAPAPPSNPPL